MYCKIPLKFHNWVFVEKLVSVTESSMFLLTAIQYEAYVHWIFHQILHWSVVQLDNHLYGNISLLDKIFECFQMELFIIKIPNCLFNRMIVDWVKYVFIKGIFPVNNFIQTKQEFAPSGILLFENLLLEFFLINVLDEERP